MTPKIRFAVCTLCGAGRIEPVFRFGCLLFICLTWRRLHQMYWAQRSTHQADTVIQAGFVFSPKFTICSLKREFNRIEIKANDIIVGVNHTV